MKIRTCLIVLFLTVNFVFKGFTQDTYEYAMVYTAANYIQVASKDGVTGYKMEKGQWVQSEVIKKVNELALQGWDVYTSTSASESAGSVVSAKEYVFFLRRKLK
ncbi:MAG TPA: hypothetical protein VK174_02470 [Chitinophagales bacterium]|nr:hypothetical protein [Chitinophagales bacterium]